MAEETEGVTSSDTAVATEHVPAAAPSETPHANQDDLRTIVTELKETVSALAERVELLTPDPTDTQPTKKPWTHRFGRAN